MTEKTEGKHASKGNEAYQRAENYRFVDILYIYILVYPEKITQCGPPDSTS
jgi:hypothetical protein